MRARNLASVTLASFLSKGLGFLRGIILAAFLGADLRLDGLLAVLAILGFFSFISADQLECALIKRVKEGGEAAAADGLALGAAIGFGSTVLLALFFSLSLRAFMPEFDESRISAAWRTLYGLGPLIVLYAPYRALTGILKASGRFGLAIALDSTQSALLLGFTYAGLVLRPDDPILALAVSQSLAFLVCFMGAVAACRPTVFRALSGASLDRRTFREMGILVAFQAALYSLTFVDRHFAALAVPGGIAILGYASSLSFALRSAINYEQVYLLDFSDKNSATSEKLRTALKTCMLVAIPSGVYLALLAGQLVTAVYQRGAFSPTDASSTALTLMVYGSATVPFLVWAVLLRMLQSLGRTKEALAWLLPALVLDIVVASRTLESMGVAAAVLGTLAAHIVLISGAVISLRKDRIWDIGFKEAALVAGWHLPCIGLALLARTACVQQPGILPLGAASALYFGATIGIPLLLRDVWLTTRKPHYGLGT